MSINGVIYEDTWCCKYSQKGHAWVGGRPLPLTSDQLDSILSGRWLRLQVRLAGTWRAQFCGNTRRSGGRSTTPTCWSAPCGSYCSAPGSDLWAGRYVHTCSVGGLLGGAIFLKNCFVKLSALTATSMQAHAYIFNERTRDPILLISPISTFMHVIM